MWNDKDGSKYCLKIDIKHYYQSINHDILIKEYKNLFKDKDLIWLLSEIIGSITTAEKEDLEYIYSDINKSTKTGIPIGNYLSQYSGNFYLSQFDHWIKEQQKLKIIIDIWMT